MKRLIRLAIAAAILVGLIMAAATAVDAAVTRTKFELVRSEGAAAADCLPNAHAHVTIRSIGSVEIMSVKAHGLPANTEFDLFVTQVADAPFGLSWYQGDMETNRSGKASGTFIGRFSEETFTVAPGRAAAPVVHDDGDFPDADTNPATAPVHQFHLGLWFDSPADAAEAGCPDTTTPFNGDHDAGIQILSSRQFPDEAGPLAQIS